MEATYAQYSPQNPQLDMADHLLHLEDCIRTLLEAVGSSLDNDGDVEPRLTFDVCMDGRRYTISILESALDAEDPQHRLTAREQDVVRLISKGFTTKTIASVLGLRPCTVSTYTKRIYLKLNVNSRAEMVAKVLNQPSLFAQPIN